MFGLFERPLIVAPMAGGPSSAELIAAASNAGALGSIGAAYSSPSAIKEITEKVRSLTAKPIAINLFIPHPQPVVTEVQAQNATTAMAPFRQSFGLPVPVLTPPYEEDFDQQFEMVLKLKPEFFSFVFGVLPKEYTRAAKSEGIKLIGTATSLDEALELKENDVDAITLQGIEAGGHRGLFSPVEQDPEIPMLPLLIECHKKIKTPLVAAGGIMNSTDIKLALSNGATAVQMGTAFLATEEAGTNPAYKNAVLQPDRKTKTTRAFSGRLARGIINPFMQSMDDNPSAILPFPAQNKFTRDLRNASAAAESPQCLSLWCGTGSGEMWTGTVAGLVDQLFAPSK
ncbi:nitronate monooxygenase [Bdellovibrio sp. SKB1291214]|uniref:NAD(P)H-dependent flavin oxidoreductase n=1 Tax=Bdellovibrio sp. SKB1291214 TaxID=1732569 RepID=UPI000B517499|nr:nitronate monooxygenase [Bdellovibrio sp. SKB1291214]UYL07387.1 nitronate monooxygenase [Bdellovibrio sp. SKB1291214]